MSAHRYWRINITANNGSGSFLDVAELEFWETQSSGDATGSGTAIFSSQDPSFPASNAFNNDGNSTTWFTNIGTNPLPQYLGYDFGSGVTKDITYLALTCWASSEHPKNFSLDYSDNGTSWTTLFSITNATGWSAGERRFYNASGQSGSVFFLDPEAGNDSNDGTTFANRWKTFGSGATAARIAPGDTIRVIASPDETSVGNATWTQGSKTVTLATACNVDVDPCNSAWTAATNVTASTSSTRKEGALSTSLAIASAFTTGKAGAIQRVDESVAAGAHRYWRLLATAGVGRNFLGIAELQMRIAYGGSNVVSGGTALESSHFGSNTASLAFDGNTSTFYASGNGTMPEYVGYDFGSGVTKEIVEVSFLGRQDGFCASDSPASGAIQYSDDGSTWTTSWSISTAGVASGQPATIFSKPSVATSPIDLSGNQQVSFWIQTNLALAASVLSLRLCSDTAGATTVNTLLIPAIPVANVWHCFTIDNGAALGSNINSVALYAESDPGTVTVLLDNIIACKAKSSADSLTLGSLIGKVWNRAWIASTTYAANDIRIPTPPNRNGFRYKVTAGGGGSSGSTEPTWPEGIGITVTDGALTWTCEGVEDTWYPIQSIRSTTVLIDNAPSTSASAGLGTYSESETVATYKREPLFTTPATNTGDFVNEVKDSGTANAPIVFSGGWDRTAMTAQTGQSWLSGRNGRGFAVACNNQIENWNLFNFGFTRYYYGWRGYSNIGGNYRIDSVHAVGCESIGFHIGTFPINVYGKGVVACNSMDTGVYTPGGMWDLSRVRIEGNTNYGVNHDTYLYRGRIAVGNVRNNTTAGLRSLHDGQFIAFNLKLAANGVDVIDTYGIVRMHNCDLASTTEYSGRNAGWNTFTSSGKNDQTAGNHVLTFDGGTIVSATDQRHTASGISWKFRPTSTKRGELYPMVLPLGKLAVTSGVAVSATIWTRRDSTNIKGRFRVRGGQLGGVGEQTITCEPSVNTWTQSSAIAFTPTEDGIVELEFAAFDGVGTTNNLWIDDLTVA